MHPPHAMTPVSTPGAGTPTTPAWPNQVAHTTRLILDWASTHPWIATIPTMIIAMGILTRIQVRRRRNRRLHHHAQLITITPPPEVEPPGAAVFWATMAHAIPTHPRSWTPWHGRHQPGRGPRPHVTWEYRWTGRHLKVCLWVPGTIPAAPIQAAIRGAWPGAATTLAPATPPLPGGGASIGGTLTPVLPGWYPLRTDHDTDPLRTLIAAGSLLHHTETACVQILTRPASPRRRRRLRHGVATLRTPGGAARHMLDPTRWLQATITLLTDLLGDLLTPTGHRTRHTTTAASTAGTMAAVLRSDPQRDRDARAAVDKLTGPHWEVALRYGITRINPRNRTTGTTASGATEASDAVRAQLVTRAHGLASAFGAWAGRNHLRTHHLPQPVTTLTTRALHRAFVLDTAELASLAALPQDLAVPGLLRARATPMPAPVDIPTGGRATKPLGTATVGGHPIALPVADARHHVHLLGSTGSGKSTLMLNLILADVHAGRGTVVIDPKGDLVTDVLDRLPVDHAHKVVIIDPDQNPGATLNPLAGDDPDLVVDNITSIFSKIFTKHWGPRIDDVLRVSCLTLMRKTNATLTLVPPLLNDRRFRHTFTADLDDPDGLRGFWEWFEATPPPLRSQIIGPVLARLRAFLLRDFVRRTLGTPESSLDMTRILNGGLLLVRLPKGQIGEDTARLMGSFVVASVWQAATARTRLPAARRRDACLYIDEAHNFLTLPGSVSDMLAEARGYHLSLVLAHQNLTQLPRDTQLGLSANARNKIFFSCAPEDAHQLARHTLPELTEHDLSHQDAYQAATRLVIDNRETPAFTLHTNPPRPVVGQAAAIRAAVSRAETTRHTEPETTPTAPAAT